MRRAIILSLALIAVDAAAIDSDQWAIHGLGANSCGSYIVALSENKPTEAIRMQGHAYLPMANAYTQWILGFVTSANLRASPGSGQILVDANGIALWVKNYCETNPSSALSSAASAFVNQHQPKVK